MNGRDLLINLEEECFKGRNFNKIKDNYRIIQESLLDFNVANYFFQTSIKSKSSQGKNFSVGEKTFEICFFNSQFIHDITVTPESIAHSIFDISSINKLVIKTDSVNGKCDFNIYGNSDGTILFYSFDQSRFEEINIFKNELFKIIIARSITT
jgi:hypothetical protein